MKEKKGEIKKRREEEEVNRWSIDIEKDEEADVERDSLHSTLSLTLSLINERVWGEERVKPPWRTQSTLSKREHTGAEWRTHSMNER